MLKKPFPGKLLGLYILSKRNAQTLATISDKRKMSNMNITLNEVLEEMLKIHDNNEYQRPVNQNLTIVELYVIN